ncbi:MAG TPA: hypothetical protein VH371_04040, partial [Candidatus Limnocylindrales bacterium]
MRAARALGVLLVLILAGCSAQPPSPSPSDAVTAGDSSYDHLFDQIGDDGSVSMATALQAFALAIAPLPGVTPPQGSDPPLYERMDATFAIDWLTPYLDQLTPDQQAAVAAALTPASDAVVIQPTGAPGATPNGFVPNEALAAGPGFVSDASPDQVYVDQVSAAVPVIAAKLGRGLHWPINVTLNPTQKAGADFLAYTEPELSQGRTKMTGCNVFVNPLLVAQNDFPLVQEAMAHEAFHCFQLQLEFETGHLTFYNAPTNKGKATRYGWIIEGQAQWVGEAVAGPTQDGDAWWSIYLASPERPLWRRTYDAQGFYQHLAEEGIDPWSVFDAMLETDSDQAAYLAANGSNDQFLNTWASGFVRNQSLPQAWDAQGPWFTNAHAQVVVKPVKNGDSFPLEAAPVTNADFALQSTADITELTFKGHARMYTDGVDTPAVETVDLCTNTTANACNCPAGLYYNGPYLQPS